MLIIKNGKVIDPVADRVYPADLYIENDTMVKIVDHAGFFPSCSARSLS